MKSVDNRPLRVFLCHSSADKPAVRELYQKLRAEPWIQPWLDEEELYPGDDWDLEIEKAVEESDVVLVCLSNGSINKRGYVQKELRFALDIALEIPEEEVFIIPLRLEECTPPRSLRDWQYADYFEGKRENAHQRLLVSLKRRADSLGLKFEKPASKKEEKPVAIEKNATEKYLEDFHEKHAKPLSEYATDKITLSNGMEFMKIPAGEFLMGSNNGDDFEKPQHIVDIPYDYWMARFPVTNELYNIYLKGKSDEWEKGDDFPTVEVNWKSAMKYCQWLHNLLKNEYPSNLMLRLPTEAEWEKAARGTDGRKFPWGNQFDKNRCNTKESGRAGVTRVSTYSVHGDSPYGCSDMSGNVWEWTNSLKEEYPYRVPYIRENEKPSGPRILRGGSFLRGAQLARCTIEF